MLITYDRDPQRKFCEAKVIFMQLICALQLLHCTQDSVVFKDDLPELRLALSLDNNHLKAQHLS